MKKFIKYIVLLLFIVVAQLYFFDSLFNQIYEKGIVRDKIKWMRSMEFNDTIDYVLLGSSRCIYHLEPKILDAKSGLKGFNFGYPSSGPFEIKLMLKELLKKAKVKTIYIQVDHYYNQKIPDELGLVSWMPYMNDEVYEEFKPYGLKFSFLKYIPFYKYQVFDPQIGVRNAFLTLIRKEADFTKRNGFTALSGEKMGDSSDTFAIFDEENQIFKDIIRICEKSNIELVFYTSPVYKSTTNYSVIKKYLPKYYDLSESIADKKLFKDATHLNGKGAEVFTEIFYDKVFKNHGAKNTKLQYAMILNEEVKE